MTEPCVTPTTTIIVGHRADGTLCTTVTFDTGEQVTAEAGDPDLGFDECDTILHDVAHTLISAALGLRRSPVLERVADLAPLTQEHVDLEEAAIFALQAWCAGVTDRDYRPHLANVRTALDRLAPLPPVRLDPGPCAYCGLPAEHWYHWKSGTHYHNHQRRHTI